MNDDFLLRDKVAFITGGASGIGHAAALRFRRAGAKVVIADLAAQLDSLDASDWRLQPIDVSDSDSFQAALQATRTELGVIDILVNNAGINGDDGVPLVDCDDDLTRRLFEVNTLGVYFGLKYGARAMCDGGAIINTASLAADYVFPGSGPYSATKAAVVSLTQMAAAELAGRKIRVNAVAPAFVKTPLAENDIELFEKVGREWTHAERIAEADEVAAVIQFLASDAASYVNGQVIRVDGGMACGMTSFAVDQLVKSMG